jgi:predicted MarR family transcription regulator
MIASEAFNRWVVRCMGAAGVRDLSTLDVSFSTASITAGGRSGQRHLFVLNIEDAHLVTYAEELGRLGWSSAAGAARRWCSRPRPRAATCARAIRRCAMPA